MADKQTVFLSEYVSEDTNPWDSRERYGLFSTFAGAARTLDWITKDYKAGKWVESGKDGGSQYGERVKHSWKYCDPDEDGEYYDDGSGYGIYIWEEYVD